MFYIAGHRAGNSVDSIFNAIKKGYDYVELDVHLSKDEQIIVQYEPQIIVRGNNCLCEDIDLNIISPDDKNKILLLDQVLEITKGKIGVIIDIKHGSHFYANIGEKIASLVKSFDMCQDSWLISFDHMCLNEAKTTESTIRIAPMYVARIYQERDYWTSIQADGVEICNEYLDLDSVLAARNLGLTTIGWCTKDYGELRRLISMGIDIITTETEEDCFRYLNSLRGVY